MNTSRIWPLIMIGLAAVLALTPWVIFPVCGIGRFGPVSGLPSGTHGCGGTLMAETVLGLFGLAAGTGAFLKPSRPVLLAAAVSAALTGLLAVLFPTMITGMCMMAGMPCVYGTRPALIAAGSLMLLLGLIGVPISRRMP